jgi:hypothetical protein
MKRYIFALFALLLCAGIKAQTDQENQNEIRTVFNSTERVGWWVSTDFAWSQIDNRDAFIGGLSGGIIINHEFSIGLAGYGIMNSENFRYTGINDTADVYLYAGYGGLKLEYRLNPTNMFNIAFPVLIGGGGVVYSTMGQNNWQSSNNNDDAYAWDSFFVIEPGVVVGINLLKFMRLDLGVSYRYAPGINLPETDSDLLNGFNATASLKFGRF